MRKKFGCLNKDTWEDDLKLAFKELWRVLDDYGTLIFKWNDQSVAIEKIKPFFPDKPIIFNRIGTKGKSTYWFVFMKIPSKEQLIALNQNSPTASSHSFGEHNMRYQETSEEVSQIADATSDNANIMFNKLKMLPSDSKWKII